MSRGILSKTLPAELLINSHLTIKDVLEARRLNKEVAEFI
jgi:hypothetical protein